MNLNNFFSELKRRNVIKVATAYAIAGWLILQVVSVINEPLSMPDWFDTTAIVLVGIGFPIALIFAWAFEMTPEGLKKSKEVEITQSVTANTGKKLNRLIITVLSLAVVFLLINRVFFAQSNSIDKNELGIASIAVLPFADMSPTGDQDYFSDGLSEEILNVLAKVNEMKVAGRTSSFKFKGKNGDLKKMGAELGVAHILEGSVRKSGNKIRVTAQLIKVSDGFHVWSDTYDYNYSAENMFKIQDEISQHVLKELKVKLLGDNIAETNTIATKNTAAYEAYLKGNQLLRFRKPKDIENAITHFKEAIALDNKFSLAYARLAIAYRHLEDYGSIDRQLAMSNIKDNADSAIAINNTLGEAHAALAFYYSLQLDLDKYRETMKKAHELEPNNPEIMMWYSGSILQDKQPELKMELILKAYELDPLSPVLLSNVSNTYFINRDFKKAQEFAEKNIAINPSYIDAKARLINYLRILPNGKLGESFITAYNAHKQHPEHLGILSLLSQTALDLNLIYISEQVEEKMQALYPENYATVGVHFQNYFYKKDWISIAREVEAAFDKRGYAKENEIRVGMEMDVNYYLNSYDKAIEYLEKHHPIYLSDTLSSIPYDRKRITGDVAVLCKLTGHEAVANRLTDIFCKDTESKLKHNGDISKEDIDILNQMRNCAALQGDAKKASTIINEMYFNRKLKTNIYDVLDMNYKLDLIHDSPEYKAIRARITADKKLMRAKAIAFLKAEGAWTEDMEE